MQSLLEPARPGVRAGTCAVLLPPAYARPADFIAGGFATAVRTRNLEIDLLLPQLQTDHVIGRTAVSELHELLAPLRGRGYRSIWIGGISLGGLIALAYAMHHAHELEGVVVLAPYLGSHLISGEIARAGGLRQWQPRESDPEDDERRIWRFLKEGARGLPLHLGFGAQDRFAHSHRLLAEALATTAVDSVPGGHDWPTWARLWDNFLMAAHGHSGAGG